MILAFQYAFCLWSSFFFSPATGEGGDLEKILSALGIFQVKSFRDLLAVFGLGDIPDGHLYGIVCGCLVFGVTISSVLLLLVKGGSFSRMVSQEKGEGELLARMLTDRTALRAQRGLLQERLLDCQTFLTQAEKNFLARKDDEENEERFPHVTEKLLNFDPKLPYDSDRADNSQVDLSPPEIIDEDTGGVVVQKKFKSDMQNLMYADKSKSDPAVEVTPEMKTYETNFVDAYRRCQLLPGGHTLPGVPEARYEAYGRSVAGVPDNDKTTARGYKKSYGRMYEAISCKTHKTEERFRKHYQTRPRDIIGRTVRLEPLSVSRHAQKLVDVTCGEVCGKDTDFDPMDVWGFLPYGPFKNAEEIASSPIFNREHGEGGFAIVESVTEQVIGCVLLSNDNPQNLTIKLEVPIMKPTCDGSCEELEAAFLLLDRLFAYGYRRVYLTTDKEDAIARKVPARIGMTQEGLILKDMIVREANRDSLLFAMLNSDWDRGARYYLFAKLHCEPAARADKTNLEKEEEEDEKQESLKLQAEKAKMEDEKKLTAKNDEDKTEVKKEK